MRKKVKILKTISNLLNSLGRMVNLVSSPEIYTHEWASFSTNDFPENKHAKSGDNVWIIQTDTEDKRPVADILWTPEYYRETYKKAGLVIVETYKPLAKASEPYRWISETRIAPWTTYVLRSRHKKKAKTRRVGSRGVFED